MGETLTKARIAARVFDRVGVTRTQSAELVDDVFELVRATLATTGEVRIAGFGAFQVRTKAARRGRNPHTSEALIIDRRRVLVFKPSPVFRRKLNREQG